MRIKCLSSELKMNRGMLGKSNDVMAPNQALIERQSWGNLCNREVPQGPRCRIRFQIEGGTCKALCLIVY